jgi:hypothetical protein
MTESEEITLALWLLENAESGDDIRDALTLLPDRLLT